MRTLRRPGAYVCGVDAALDVVGGKWKVLILWALGERPCRFGALRRELPGVTEKVLAAQLRELEADGIVRRQEYDEVPPRVEYSLTPRGAALNDALAPLGDWGREHVLGDAYDGTAGTAGTAGERGTTRAGAAGAAQGASAAPPAPPAPPGLAAPPPGEAPAAPPVPAWGASAAVRQIREDDDVPLVAGGR